MCQRPNLKTFVTLEKEHPVPSHLGKLINDSFQPNYIQSMMCYALCHDDHKRKHLTRLLTGSVCSQSCAELVTSRQALVTKRREQDYDVSTTQSVNGTSSSGIPMLNLSKIKESPDFVIQSGNSTINMNSAFTARSPRKRLFQNSFRSQIKDDGIFGHLPPLSPKPQGSGTLTKYICDKLFVPAVSKMILPHAEENIAFIREISNWVDTAANYYPYDPKPKDQNSNPRFQAKLFSTILKEDHMFKQTYAPTQPETPRYMQDQIKTTANPMSTTYHDDFNQEEMKRYTFHPTKPVYQERSGKPFSLYPAVEPEKYEYTNEQFIEQVKDNKRAFRTIRNHNMS